VEDRAISSTRVRRVPQGWRLSLILIRNWILFSHGRIEERNFKDSDSLAALDAVHTKSALDGKLLYLSVQALPKHRRLRDHAETQ